MTTIALGKKNLKNSTIINTICVLLLIYGVVTNNNYIFIIVTLMVVFTIIISLSYENILYTCISLIPFQKCLTFNGISAMPLISAALVLRIIANKDFKLKNQSAICAIIMLILGIINDGMEVSTWSFASWFAFTLMAIFIIDKVIVERLEPWQIIYHFYFSVVAVTLCNFLGFSTELSESSSIRLGSQYSQLGGAMGLPLYMLLISSLLIIMYMFGQPTKIQKLFIISSVSIFNLVALSSLSRAYFIGLSIMFVCLFLGSFSAYGSRTLRMVAGLSIILLILVYFNLDNLLYIIGKLEARFAAHMEDNGRTGIWLSCIEYLKTHKRALVIGNGALTYQNEGGASYRFYLLTAHNIYLDSIMAFGVIGTVSIINLYLFFYKKCQRALANRINVISLMPFLVLSAYYLTSGSFRYYKTWFYYIIVIYFAFITSSGGNRQYDP